MKAILLLLLLIVAGVKLYPVLESTLEKLPVAANWIKICLILGGITLFVPFAFILAAFIGLLFTKSPEKLAKAATVDVAANFVASVNQSGGVTTQTIYQGDKFRPIKERIIEQLDSINKDLMPMIRSGKRSFNITMPQVVADELLRLTVEDRERKFVTANTFNNLIMGGGFGPQTTVHILVTDELAK